MALRIFEFFQSSSLIEQLEFRKATVEQLLLDKNTHVKSEKAH